MPINAREKTEENDPLSSQSGTVTPSPSFGTLRIVQVLSAVLGLLVISVDSAFWCSE